MWRACSSVTCCWVTGMILGGGVPLREGWRSERRRMTKGSSVGNLSPRLNIAVLGFHGHGITDVTFLGC